MYSPFDPTDEEAGYPEEPRCPLCHERCDTVYRTDDGVIVGCLLVYYKKVRSCLFYIESIIIKLSRQYNHNFKEILQK